MNKNLKFFFVTFLLSLPFWWGVNVFGKNLENFFFSRFYQSPQTFSAQVLPITLSNPRKDMPEISAKAALSVKIDKLGSQKILFEKNPDEILPIASLTKLMTALIVFENYDFSQEIKISREAIDQPEDLGQLKVGERLSVENLLYILLIESSNDAAYALSEVIGEEALVDLMNIEAKFLGLKNTLFVDPGGWSQENYSNAKDLAKFSQYLLKKYPEIFEITKIPEFDLYDKDGIFHHKLLNTNEILKKYPEIFEITKIPEFDLYDKDGIFHHKLLNTNEILKKYPQIVGGKTGYTSQAKGCFLLILENPEDKSLLINVILGSENRFSEMEKLINWAQ